MQPYTYLPTIFIILNIALFLLHYFISPQSLWLSTGVLIKPLGGVSGTPGSTETGYVAEIEKFGYVAKTFGLGFSFGLKNPLR